MLTQDPSQNQDVQQSSESSETRYSKISLEFCHPNILSRFYMKTNNISLSRYTRCKSLVQFGFPHKRVPDIKLSLCERTNWVNMRGNYLRPISEKREEVYKVIYLDDTLTHAHHTPSYQWQRSDTSQNRQIPPGEGERLIVLHAWSLLGFLPGCKLSFSVKIYSTDATTVFTEYVTEELPPTLPDKGLVVMDKHHITVIETHMTKKPSKFGIFSWLLRFSVARKGHQTKVYEIILANKPPPEYLMDIILTHF